MTKTIAIASILLLCCLTLPVNILAQGDGDVAQQIKNCSKTPGMRK